MENGKWKSIVSKLCLVSILPIAFSATAENYQAKICYNCNETEAKSIVLSREFEPELTCYSDDIFSPDYTQSCYSQPNEVLVANASTRQIWGYRVFHKNQGSAEYELELKAQSFNVSSQARSLMNDIITEYAKLDAVIASVNKDFESPSAIFNSTANTSFASSSSKSILGTYTSSNCDENSSTAKAVRAGFDPRTITSVLDSVQADFRRRYSNPASQFTYSRFTGVNFSAGAGSVGIGGSWEFVTNNRLLVADFTSDVPGLPTNKISYNVHMQDNVIDIAVNESASRIDGIAISTLKTGTVTNTDACMLEHLNKYWEASVQSSASGGHFGNGGLTDYGRGFNFVPQSSNGGGGETEICTWRFYNPQGEPTFTMQGPCP
ncbi:MAG: hypothetical protein AAF364_02365 [Pseudomonadota bacterium]